MIYTEKDFQEDYDIRVDGQNYTYGRVFAMRAATGEGVAPFYHRRATLVAEAIKGLRDPSILVLGCGYGYLNISLNELGYTQVYGVEGSEYLKTSFEAEKLGESVIAWRDVFYLPGVISDLGQDKFEVVVTEDLINTFSELELTQIESAVGIYMVAGGTTVHILAEIPEAYTYIKDHTYISSRTGKLKVGGG